jgi:dienelactone hydrolase
MTTNVGMSACCLSGSIHNGTPTGKEDKIGGLDVYISLPESGQRSKSVVILTDIFGWKFPNVRLLADNYAKAGFAVYIPDLHQGDSLPEEFLQTVEPPLAKKKSDSMVEKTKQMAIVTATLPPWLIKHREGVTLPLLKQFLSAVQTIPSTGKVGTLGFCWGGRYAVLTAHGDVDAAVACHPSLLAIPGDLEKITKPVSLAVGTEDSLLDVESVKKIQDVLGKLDHVPHEIQTYEDQVHGFALRSDWGSEKDKKAMDDAEKQGIAWFEKYLA